ncbi:hypothetical protein MHH52_15415 [Paenibacillus sp. FSL K6-0276]|uniref:hypothetical protein n=1 Tax=Paenibacillus sp. FSL K6-0276 TaxID=2921450 RepID=UPI0030EF7906
MTEEKVNATPVYTGREVINQYTGKEKLNEVEMEELKRATKYTRMIKYLFSVYTTNHLFVEKATVLL